MDQIALLKAKLASGSNFGPTVIFFFKHCWKNFSLVIVQKKEQKLMTEILMVLQDKGMFYVSALFGP